MPVIKATANWVENVRTIVDNSRTHTIVCDLPIAQGGNDTGPTALELAVMSIADCAATIFADVCKQSKIDISRLQVVAEAEKPSGSYKLEGVSIKVRITGKARKQLLEAAWRRTEAMCPVLVAFKEAIPLKATLETTIE